MTLCVVKRSGLKRDSPRSKPQLHHLWDAPFSSSFVKQKHLSHKLRVKIQWIYVYKAHSTMHLVNFRKSLTKLLIWKFIKIFLTTLRWQNFYHIKIISVETCEINKLLHKEAEDKRAGCKCDAWVSVCARVCGGAYVCVCVMLTEMPGNMHDFVNCVISGWGHLEWLSLSSLYLWIFDSTFYHKHVTSL